MRPGGGSVGAGLVLSVLLLVGCAGGWFVATTVDRSDRRRVRSLMDRLVLTYESEDPSGLMEHVTGEDGVTSGSFRAGVTAQFRSVEILDLRLHVDRISSGEEGPRVEVRWVRRWRPDGGGTVTRYGRATLELVDRGGSLRVGRIRGENPFL